jgi:putative spermidine/putrescine transport system substrate-binding protein
MSGRSTDRYLFAALRHNFITSGLIMQRRTFSKLLATSTALGAVGTLPHAYAQVRQLRMIESGGTTGEAVEAGFIKPFTQKTGIRVIRESPNDLGKLRAIVESGSTATTVYELGASALFQAKALGLLQKLDWDKIDPLPMFPEARDDYGMGYQYYSIMMAWRKGAKAPKNWADFFNYKDFPGKRALPNNPVYVLPAVLLASGIPMEKLYPLDVDLAFRKLEAIKPEVSVWWKAMAQPPQLLRDNEVQYAIASSGRVAGQEGIESSFNQANFNLSYFCIVKGASPAEVDAAYKLFREVTDAKNQATAAEIIPYTGNSPDLEALLPKDKLKFYSTTAGNKQIQYQSDNLWWFKNADAVQKRWQEFVLTL